MVECCFFVELYEGCWWGRCYVKIFFLCVIFNLFLKFGIIFFYECLDLNIVLYMCILFVRCYVEWSFKFDFVDCWIEIRENFVIYLRIECGRILLLKIKNFCVCFFYNCFMYFWRLGEVCVCVCVMVLMWRSRYFFENVDVIYVWVCEVGVYVWWSGFLVW